MCFCVHTLGKSYDMNVSDSDYLRILQGGNFIKFVCMALDEQNKKSVVTTEDFRLKVNIQHGTLSLHVQGLSTF